MILFEISGSSRYSCTV